MTVTPTRFATQLLTTSPVTLYTAPASTRAVIKRIAVTNITGTDATVKVTITPSGGSAITLTNSSNVAAGTSLVLNEWANMVLQPGDAFSAQAGTASALNIAASGFVVS